jgi:M6 family metalloprotease-like protein
MKRIFLAFIIIFSLVLADKIGLAKTDQLRIPGEGQAIEKFIKNIRKLRLFERFQQNRPRRPAKLISEGKTVTQKVLALRVEFVEDDDTLTTGNGKMDFMGFLEPDSGLFYDPPHTRLYFERHLQGLNNYLRANSIGKYSIEYAVKPDSFDLSYQLPHEMKFYGDTISNEGLETGLCLLLRDAIKAADLDPTVNFAEYDHIIIFHAGSDLQSDYGNKGNSPFDLASATIPSGALEYYLGEPYVLTDEGAQVYTATIVPEMTRQDTMYGGYVSILGMTGLAGTLFHEFCHLLGAYDLYDVTGWSMGVGAWSLMGYGAWLGEWSAGSPPGTVPGMLDPYHKILFGWFEPLVINVPKESIPVFASTIDTSLFNFRGDSLTPIIIKVPITNSEYFLIENRREGGIPVLDTITNDTIITLGVDVEDGVVIAIDYNQYDFFLPGSGVLIWHIDEQIISEFGPYNAINIDPLHKGVDLEEADGIQDYDGWYYFNSYEIFGSPYDPFFIGGYLNEFGPNTIPNSNSYYGKTFITITVNSGLDSIMPVSIKFDLFQAGFPKDIGPQNEFLAAKYADLDLDGNTEIIVPTLTGEIYAWKSDGSPFIDGSEGLFAPAFADFYSTIAIGDILGDEQLEVVSSGADGSVYIFGSSGNQPIIYLNTTDKIRAAPVLADLNGDGKKDIIVSSMDMRIYAWRGDGQPISDSFPKYIGSEVRTSVAITNENDPKIVALGSDNRLFLINKDGTTVSGFPKDLSISPLLTYSPPVVGDIDRDGNQEIIVVVNSGYDYRLVILDLAGNIKDQTRDIIRNPAYTAPALADIDHDGFLEILVAAKNKIYAFNHNGTLVTNYPCAQDSTYPVTEIVGDWLITSDIDFIYNSSLVIGDIDKDGTPDIIIGSPQFGILGFNSHNGNMLDYFPLMTLGPVSTPPLIFDLDKDGDLEIAAGDNEGRFYIWSLPGDTSLVWGQFLGNSANTGKYPDALLPLMPEPTDTMVKNFYIYPNPAKDDAVVRYWLGTGITDVKIRIFDIAGDPVSKEYVGKNQNLTDNEVMLPISSIASGVYLVRLEVAKGEDKQVQFYKLAITR